jgi:NADH:ubiquinone reductase (H+-translocating)
MPTNARSANADRVHGATSLEAETGQPHVVILGGGFAGLSAARELDGAPVRVMLIDRANHHVFQPLLYQVATAGLAPSDISVPIRWRLRKQANATVLLAHATHIDPESQRVTLDGGASQLGYDYLIVATGARHAYFGHDEWERYAPGLKSIEDAFEMRQRFLMAFELAEKSDDDEERAALMTFVIVGAGPTGVELAGALAEIVKGALRRDFRRIDTRRARVVLVEAGPRILPSFPERLSATAQRDLVKLGVEVRLGVPVTNIAESVVTIGNEAIRAGGIFWAAGNAASPLGAMLGTTMDRSGRVQVAPDLSVPSHPNVFVVGDLCAVARPDGTPAPAVAPTANQTGAHAGRIIARIVSGRSREPFRYVHKGDLATIGRHKAVAAFGRLTITGYVSWLLWVFVHLMYLVGFRNRAAVFIQWAYAYLTYQRGVRLITSTSRRT